MLVNAVEQRLSRSGGELSGAGISMGSLGVRLKNSLAVVAVVTLGLCGACTHSAARVTGDFAADAPTRLLSISDFTYAGAFALPDGGFGDSSANWAEGVIEVNGKSMFLVGHAQDDAIAQFQIPRLVSSTSVAQLDYAKEPEQAFSKTIARVSGGNRENLDQIVGLELYKGRLIVNAIEYYDGPADNRLTTFVVQNAAAIETAPVTGFYALRGSARAAGWLSQVPAGWRRALGCSHISGHSSGGPIISRLSVGPSAFCVNLDDVLSARVGSTVGTSELLGYSLDRPLNSDLFNESLSNKLWTHLSQARYGFIVPGTSTYATFGSSGGHESGVGYKLERAGGEPCGGYCSKNPSDNYNYYWFWDVRDLLKVKAGKMSASRVKPYESGVFSVPFQNGNELNQIGGASYDEQSRLLYVSILRANNTLGQYSNPPVIATFSINQ